MEKKKKINGETILTDGFLIQSVGSSMSTTMLSAKGQLEDAIASRATQRSNREKDTLRARLQDFIVIFSSRDRTG